MLIKNEKADDRCERCFRVRGNSLNRVLMVFIPPASRCSLCPRLVEFREENQRKFPHFYNGAVPSFGSLDARMLVVGLAPGLKGANASGRPFTGDFAGVVLYTALARAGLAQGTYQARADDGFRLTDVRITNAVRCVPPENKPAPEEAKTCNRFLAEEITAMPNLKLILCLGLTSHQAVLRTLKLKQKDFKFGHGKAHDISRATSHAPQVTYLLNSYHTSRYNVQTGRLTQEMFNTIIDQAIELL